MSVAASINILLKGNISDLESKLSKIEKKFRQFTDMFGLGKFFGKEAFKEVFDEVVNLGRVANRLDILPEKLAGLQLAANAAGVDFGSLTSAIQKMLVAVSGSGDPLKAAQADVAFNKLGISAQSLKGLAPEKQLAAIADALQGVGDVSDRVNIAKSIFGKGGVPILNVLRDGSKALNSWQKAAEEAGLALNRTDVGKFERVEQTFKVLQARLKGIAVQIITELAPRIEWLGKVMVAVSKVVLDFFAKWGQQIKYIIELWIVYKSVQWGVLTVERALVVVRAISSVLNDAGIKGIYAKIGAFAILTAAIIRAGFELDKLLDKLAKQIGHLTLPEMGRLEGVDVGEFNTKGLAQHPGALIRGSVEAYSAIINAGGTPMAKIETHTKNTAKGVAALVLQGRAPIKPANLGGGR